MKIVKTILIAIYRFSVQWNLFMLAAFILSLATKHISKNGKYRILALSKPVFIEDVNAINEDSNDLYFMMFPRLLLREYVKKFSNILEIDSKVKYHPTLDGTLEQEEIYLSVQKMFLYLQRFLNFDAIFAGNYTYSGEQEFFRVAKKQGIPVIILYKEGLAPPGSMTETVSKKLYTDKYFIGSKMLFYNNITRQALINARIPGITLNNTLTVGIPRLDKYFRINKQGKSNHIVLFTFEPEQKAFRFVDDDSKVALYINRGEEFQANVIRYCNENNDFHLTIKTKGHDLAKSTLRRILSKYGIDNLSNNIEITSSISSYDLITQSTYVAGFASTTLLEAVLLGRPILCPYFSDITPADKVDFFAEHPEVSNYIKDYTGLKNLMNGNSKIKLANPEIINVALKPLLFSLDGNASERVSMEIIKTVESSKKGNSIELLLENDSG